jgi:imidazolonepropionase-like amidohydrolase
VNPARFAGLQTQTGRVAVNHAADLVLLDANPLDDIGNTRKIHAVILRGRMLDRAALDEMLEKVKAHSVPQESAASREDR